MRIILTLTALLLVGACAGPVPSPSEPGPATQSLPLQTPQFQQAPEAVKKLRARLRNEPTTDGYAERYPMRYGSGTWRMYNRLKRQQQRAKKSKNRNPKAERLQRRRIVRSSWLYRDKLWAVGRAVLQMNAQDTQALMQNLQDGLEQTVANNPEKCTGITIGVPGLFPALPDKHIKVYKKQVRAAIIDRSQPEQYTIPMDRVKALMVKSHRDISQRYPNRNQSPKQSGQLNTDQARERCDRRIDQIKTMNALPMPERIGLQRIWLSSINERASLASWKTYLFYSKASKTLTVSGPMAPQLPRKLVSHFKKHPDTQKIILDSPGGLQHVGYRLAQMFRKRNLSVHVAQICFSACTVALLGSQQRTMANTAILGFHDGSRSGVSTKSLSTSLNSYRRFYPGLPDSFLEQIRDTPHNELWAPSESELLAANVITRVVESPEPFSLTESAIDWPGGLAFAADLKVNDTFWKTQARRLADLRANGMKEKTMTNYAYDDHLANLRAYRISIPDELVSQTLSFRMRLLQTIMKSENGYCVRAFAGEPQPKAFATKQPALYNEQQALLADLIKSSGPIKVSRWDAKRAKQATRELLRFLLTDRNWNQTARQWVLLNLGNPVPPIADKRTCFSLRAILDRINNARPELRGPLLRALQTSMTRWSRKDRYGQRLPWADRIQSDAAS
jgi:hypothetical protein